LRSSEPGCLLETAAHAASFFRERLLPGGTEHLAHTRGLDRREAERLIRTHVGVCLDTVHAAVMHEDPAASLRLLAAEGVGVFKIQLGSALALRVESEEDTAVLRAFAEETYLHQVTVKAPCGGLTFHGDLPAAIEKPTPGEWRVHFHLPLSPGYAPPPCRAVSGVTPAFFRQALAAGTTHLEVEIYTLGLLPRASCGVGECMARELAHVSSLVSPHIPPAAPGES